MANEQTKREAARQRILAHIKTSRQRLNNKTAYLRMIAEEEPHEVGNALDELSQLFSDIAEVFKGMAGDLSAMKGNLDLAEPGRTASIRQRVEARRNYARTLRRLANEEPEQIGSALSIIYSQVDEAVEGIEAMAERFGFPLDTPAIDEVDEAGAVGAPPEEVPAV